MLRVPPEVLSYLLHCELNRYNYSIQGVHAHSIVKLIVNAAYLQEEQCTQWELKLTKCVLIRRGNHSTNYRQLWTSGAVFFYTEAKSSKILKEQSKLNPPTLSHKVPMVPLFHMHIYDTTS